MSYHTIRETSTLDAPASGLMTGVVLQSNALPFYGVYWRWHIGTSTTLKLPASFYSYLNKNGAGQVTNMARRLVIYKDGKKLISNVVGSDSTPKDVQVGIVGAEVVLTFTGSAGAFVDATYIEVLCLDETAFNGPSHYQKVTLPVGTSGSLYTLNFNPSAYVSVKDFYRNVLVFKNGLLMSPGRTYFWWEPTVLNFGGALVAGDVLEFYFLNKSLTKPNRIYGEWPVSVAESTFVMPEFPDTQF